MKQIIVDNLGTTYYITEDGKCFNKATGKYLKGLVSNSGYLNFYLTLLSGLKRRLYAHRLVAEAYLPNPDNKQEVNHIDGNKLNNNMENLEWCTRSENIRHNTIIENTKMATPVYQFDSTKKLVNRYHSIVDAGAAGFNTAMVSQELNKPIKTLTLGYYWSKTPDNNFAVLNYANTGKAKQVGQYDRDTGELIVVFKSAGEAERTLGINHSHISECCRGKLRSYKGFIWKYIDDNI